MPVTAITSQPELKAAIAASSTRPIVIDCDATWCEPCRSINPIFDQLSSDPRFENHIDFYRLNADREETKAFMEMLGIRVLPTFVFYRGGEVLKQFRGASPTALERILGEIVEGGK